MSLAHIRPLHHPVNCHTRGIICVGPSLPPVLLRFTPPLQESHTWVCSGYRKHTKAANGKKRRKRCANQMSPGPSQWAGGWMSSQRGHAPTLASNAISRVTSAPLGSATTTTFPKAVNINGRDERGRGRGGNDLQRRRPPPPWPRSPGGTRGPRRRQPTSQTAPTGLFALARLAPPPTPYGPGPHCRGM